MATFSSLQSTVTKLSARLAENLHESARDFGFQGGLEGVVGSSARALAENGTLSTSEGAREVRKLLESPRDREREEGLKRVLALMVKGKPVTSFFPFVTNCLSSQSIQVRSLVSLYVIRQAALEPDLALLSVNMYQKDLGDPNPVVRAMALRVLSGMNLEAIASLVAMCLKRASRDGSWHVRRVAAAACGQLLRLNEAHKASLVPIIETLLADRSPLVVGCAASAFEEVCPERLGLLHPRYRTLCRLLVDADEWGQFSLLRLLARYARLNFLDPNRARDDPATASVAVDPDLDLLLRSCEPLFLSRNSAVVATAVKVYYHLGPVHLYPRLIRPYLRLLHSSQEIQQIVFEDLLELTAHQPDLLSTYVQQFYVRGADSSPVKAAKLRCLAALATPTNARALLRELLEYVRDDDPIFAAETIKAIGECAARLPDIAEECLDALLELARGQNATAISQAVVVIGSLIDSLTDTARISRHRIISQLVFLLQSGRLPESDARVHVYWLVGQHVDQDMLNSIAPDALRLGVRAFAQEHVDVKLQLLNLGARLLLASHQSSLGTYTRIIALLFDHLASLARYDVDYGVRDRARFLKGLVVSCGVALKATDTMPLDAFGRGEDAPTESDAVITMSPSQVDAVLFASRAASRIQSGNVRPSKPLSGWAYLPAWTQVRSQSSLRDNPEEVPNPRTLSAMNGIGSISRASPVPRASASASPVVLTPRNNSPAQRASSKPRDLNDFLASESEESAEESDEEETSDSQDEEDSEEEANEDDENEDEEAASDESVNDDARQTLRK